MHFVLLDLLHLGLVYMRKESARRFYPTRFALNLVSNAPLQRKTLGYIIVENTFKVYAYTNSKLQVGLLRLFVDIEYQLPNLIVGTISRDKVIGAVRNGISSEQVLKFLHANAHRETLSKSDPVPFTVADQIRLWEGELHRIKDDHGFLYRDFDDLELFQLVADFAEENGALLFKGVEHMHLFIDQPYHEMMKEFIQRQREKRNASANSASYVKTSKPG